MGIFMRGVRVVRVPLVAPLYGFNTLQLSQGLETLLLVAVAVVAVVVKALLATQLVVAGAAAAALIMAVLAVLAADFNPPMLRVRQVLLAPLRQVALAGLAASMVIRLALAARVVMAWLELQVRLVKVVPLSALVARVGQQVTRLTG
jgi:hypothetical protein